MSREVKKLSNVGNILLFEFLLSDLAIKMSGDCFFSEEAEKIFNKLEAVCRGEREMTEELASKLSSTFNTSQELWMNLGKRQ